MKRIKDIIQPSDTQRFPFDVIYWKCYNIPDKKDSENKLIQIEFYSTTKYLAYGFYKPISRTINLDIFNHEL